MELTLAMFAGIGLFAVGFILGITVGIDDTVDAEFENLDGRLPNKKGRKLK